MIKIDDVYSKKKVKYPIINGINGWNYNMVITVIKAQKGGYFAIIFEDHGDLRDNAYTVAWYKDYKNALKKYNLWSKTYKTVSFLSKITYMISHHDLLGTENDDIVRDIIECVKFDNLCISSARKKLIKEINSLDQLTFAAKKAFSSIIKETQL